MRPSTGIARGTSRDRYISVPSRKALRAGTPVPSTKVQSRTARSEPKRTRVSEAPPPRIKLGSLKTAPWRNTAGIELKKVARYRTPATSAVFRIEVIGDSFREVEVGDGGEGRRSACRPPFPRDS